MSLTSIQEHNWQYLTLYYENRVLTVQFDAGNRINSLSNALMRELTELALQLQEDCELSAIVLSGRESMFSGGMDLKDPEAIAARTGSVAEKRLLVKTGPKMCAAWEALEPVTIVAIEGWCVGGGSGVGQDTRRARRRRRLAQPTPAALLPTHHARHHPNRHAPA